MRLILAILTFVAYCISGASAQDRVALVVGNDRYSNLPSDRQLGKAVNDARAVGGALEKLGFKVFRGENLSRTQMVDQIFSFAQAIKPGDTAVLFFAGHGVSLSGGNYLLPSDVPLLRAGEEVRAKNFSLGEADIVADIQERKPRVLVMMLDACRDNPFKQPGLTRSIGGDTGLARGREAEGVFTIYSAGFGQSALDSLGSQDDSPNSVFTRALVPALARTDVHLADLVIDMREQVAKLAASIGHQQYPAYYDQTRGGRVYLASRPVNTGVVFPSTIAIAPVPSLTPVARKAALIVVNSNYLNHAPPKNGKIGEFVRAALGRAGFDLIDVRNDLTRDAMLSALDAFSVASNRAEVALIFFSGHGARLESDRYLIAIDGAGSNRAEMRQTGISIAKVIEATKGAKLRLLTIDADQSDPYAPGTSVAAAESAFDPLGAIVLYAAGPSEVTKDGSSGISPFAAAFARSLESRGGDVAEVLSGTIKLVSDATKNTQKPVLYGTPPRKFSLTKP